MKSKRWHWDAPGSENVTVQSYTSSTTSVSCQYPPRINIWLQYYIPGLHVMHATGSDGAISQVSISYTTDATQYTGVRYCPIPLSKLYWDTDFFSNWHLIRTDGTELYMEKCGMSWREEWLEGRMIMVTSLRIIVSGDTQVYCTGLFCVTVCWVLTFNIPYNHSPL